MYPAGHHEQVITQQWLRAGEAERERDRLAERVKRLVEVVERCRSVITTNMNSMEKEGFDPNPWDVEAVRMALEVLREEDEEPV